MITEMIGSAIMPKLDGDKIKHWIDRHLQHGQREADATERIALALERIADTLEITQPLNDNSDLADQQPEDGAQAAQP